MFEAQIVVPDFPQPLHFFTTHLKAHPDQDSAERRGAEARAISNFLARAYLTTNSHHPYVLVGDLNEDIYRPRTYEQGVIQTLTSLPTGLRITTPRNPVTADDRTWSIQNANLTIRLDYVLPCALLYYSATDGRVFRSDKVSPPSPPLLAVDSATATDHLPLMLTFRNPYNVPLVINSLALSNQVATLRWSAIPGERYRVERSSTFAAWQPTLTSLTATTNQLSVQLPATNSVQFFRLARER